jgi:hypothetical protein
MTGAVELQHRLARREHRVVDPSPRASKASHIVVVTIDSRKSGTRAHSSSMAT